MMHVQRKYKIDYSLYLVTDRKLCFGRSLEDVVGQAVQAGVTIVQLREKQSSPVEFLELAQSLKKILQTYQVPLIINDNVEIARLSQADGLHLGQSDMPLSQARAILGAESIIGLSIENKEQALESLKYKEILDYLGVSPIFDTPTKTDTAQAWGLEGLTWLRQNIDYPLIAIGGINANNAQAVLEAGADGLAVVSAICSAPSPKKASQVLDKIIKKYKYSNAN